MVLQKQVDMFIFSYANQNHDTYKKVLPTKYQMCFDTKMHFGFMDYYITLQKLTLQLVGGPRKLRNFDVIYLLYCTTRINFCGFMRVTCVNEPFDP